MKDLIIYIVAIAVGLLTGVGAYFTAKAQIKSRCEAHPELAEQYFPNAINKKIVLLAMTLLVVVVNVLAVVLNLKIHNLVYIFVIAPVLVDIMAVDLFIRRIPNQCLLILLVAKGFQIVADIVWFDGNVKVILFNSLIGLVLGFVVFLIPSFIGMYMGAGDTKLSAVVGFSVGIAGYLEAMLVSGVIMTVVLIVLKITKKGDRKTKSPMGPAFSIGFLAALLAPIAMIDISSIF